MIVNKPLALGSLRGVIIDFPDVGDVLPMHSHASADVHITIVARGSFKVHGHAWDKRLNAGDVVDWIVGQEHEFTATSANSRLVNIIKGIPD